MKRLAIVGAGPAGLAAAWKLRDSDWSVMVFEKSHGLCGRAASRTRHGVRLDPGANYIKTGSAVIEDLLKNQLPTDELVEIPGDIWTFDKEGEIEPGDPDHNSEPKWTYRSGISTLGKLLANAADCEIRRETLVARLDRSEAGWNLESDPGDQHGPFDAVLLTPPAPQSVATLKASGFGDSQLVAGLEKAEYHRQFTFTFGFDEAPQRPGDFHALINTDGGHRIAWLSFENDKPGHITNGQTVVAVQMQPDWSREHFEDDVSNLAEVAKENLLQLLGWKTEPTWFDWHRWKFAHPSSTADTAATRSAEQDGLFVAGDALIGKGRVNRALETGLEAADRIILYPET